MSECNVRTDASVRSARQGNDDKCRSVVRYTWAMSTRLPLLHADVTHAVIGAFYETYNELGWGYAESIYREAMAVVLRGRRVPFVHEAPLVVNFRGATLGTFRADLVVAGVVLVELKACTRLVAAHEAQLINYLRGSGLAVGLLFNFGATPEMRRLIWTPAEQRLTHE